MRADLFGFLCCVKRHRLYLPITWLEMFSCALGWEKIVKVAVRSPNNRRSLGRGQPVDQVGPRSCESAELALAAGIEIDGLAAVKNTLGELM